MTVTPLGRDQACSLKNWFLDPGGWSKTAAVGLYFIFPGICTLSLLASVDSKPYTKGEGEHWVELGGQIQRSPSRCLHREIRQEFIENPGKMTHTYNLCAVEAKGSSAAKYQHLYQFRTMAFMKVQMGS
ncbi:hypothetical protein STEG23_010242 [Scotinomys teguina]